MIANTKNYVRAGLWLRSFGFYLEAENNGRRNATKPVKKHASKKQVTASKP